MNVIDDEITTSDKDSKNTQRQRHLVKKSKILAIVRIVKVYFVWSIRTLELVEVLKKNNSQNSLLTTS